MTALVIGLGSMGKRRIRLLKKYDPTLRIVGLDKSESRCSEARERLGIITYDAFENVCEKEKVSYCFVCTAPLSHADIIHTALENGWHVFTELNLIDKGYDENTELARKQGKVLFLSSTFLYRKEIGYMKAYIADKGEKINYLYHAGQYLPDWHPWENYKDFFVGQRETNGCREFMAIEIPWLICVFGKIKSVQVASGTLSKLELNYPDNYIIMIEHENGNKGVVMLDVVSRKAVRNLEIIGENLYLTWDGTPKGLFEYDWNEKKNNQICLYDSTDKIDGYAEFIIEDAYYSEICNFFQVINGVGEPRYSFEQDKEVLKLINEIENI